MITASNGDYGRLDRPEVLRFLFHPRPEIRDQDPGIAVAIPVADGISIGGSFHMADKKGANILFFHGNGEIVSDYSDLGPLYNRMGINFLPVDYRGYGRSSGTPTVSAMMQDCHLVFEYARDWLAQNHCGGPLIVMGRSLGSASALELAASRGDDIDALIIESGFALAVPLLRLLGIDAAAIGFDESQGFRHAEKIAGYGKPTLIIHAQYDHIIPVSDARLLYEASGAEQKRLLEIPGANHNDIFMVGLSAYLSAVGDLVRGLTA